MDLPNVNARRRVRKRLTPACRAAFDRDCLSLSDTTTIRGKAAKMRITNIVKADMYLHSTLSEKDYATVKYHYRLSITEIEGTFKATYSDLSVSPYGAVWYGSGPGTSRK